MDWWAPPAIVEQPDQPIEPCKPGQEAGKTGSKDQTASFEKDKHPYATKNDKQEVKVGHSRPLEAAFDPFAMLNSDKPSSILKENTNRELAEEYNDLYDVSDDERWKPSFPTRPEAGCSSKEQSNVNKPDNSVNRAPTLNAAGALVTHDGYPKAPENVSQSNERPSRSAKIGDSDGIFSSSHGDIRASIEPNAPSQLRDSAPRKEFNDLYDVSDDEEFDNIRTEAPPASASSYHTTSQQAIAEEKGFVRPEDQPNKPNSKAKSVHFCQGNNGGDNTDMIIDVEARPGKKVQDDGSSLLSDLSEAEMKDLELLNKNLSENNSVHDRSNLDMDSDSDSNVQVPASVYDFEIDFDPSKYEYKKPENKASGRNADKQLSQAELEQEKAEEEKERARLQAAKEKARKKAYVQALAKAQQMFPVELNPPPPACDDPADRILSDGMPMFESDGEDDNWMPRNNMIEDVDEHELAVRKKAAQIMSTINPDNEGDEEGGDAAVGNAAAGGVGDDDDAPSGPNPKEKTKEWNKIEKLARLHGWDWKDAMWYDNDYIEDDNAEPDGGGGQSDEAEAADVDVQRRDGAWELELGAGKLDTGHVIIVCGHAIWRGGGGGGEPDKANAADDGEKRAGDNEPVDAVAQGQSAGSLPTPQEIQQSPDANKGKVDAEITENDSYADKIKQQVDQIKTTSGLDERQWLLKGFQKNEAATFVKHIKAGLLIANEKGGQLWFSGGPTAQNTPLSEGQSYKNLAEALIREGCIPSEGRGQKYELYADSFATDSFQNILFPLLQHHYLTSTGPAPNRLRHLTVVSHEFKRARFLGMHLRAMGFPRQWVRENVTYVGLDPPKGRHGRLAIISGEEVAWSDWNLQPWAWKGDLLRKRVARGWSPLRRQLFVEKLEAEGDIDPHLRRVIMQKVKEQWKQKIDVFKLVA